LASRILEDTNFCPWSLPRFLRDQGLDLESPGLSLEGPRLDLVLGLWILALAATLFITNIAASLKASTF